MKHIGIAFSTKDRVDLSTQSIQPLLFACANPNFATHIHWIDGSTTEAGENYPFNYLGDVKEFHSNIRGGADAAIVYGLTRLLQHPCRYDHIGLCENDVLLDTDWLKPTLDLFDKGESDGLKVGAVSARAYDDRVLIQRDGYAVMHNLGAGFVIFTREAAELVLRSYRTGFTIENRRVFHQVSGIDIAPTWAFKWAEHLLTADWHFDVILARHGLASLALTPAKCRMIGQDPPLEMQGLKLVSAPIERLRSDRAFEAYAACTKSIRDGFVSLVADPPFLTSHGTTTIFAHQLPMIGGWFEGEWGTKWNQATGPFEYAAAADGCRVHIPNQEAMDCEQGKSFLGFQTAEPFAWHPHVRFDYDALPTGAIGSRRDLARSREVHRERSGTPPPP